MAWTHPPCPVQPAALGRIVLLCVVIAHLTAADVVLAAAALPHTAVAASASDDRTTLIAQGPAAMTTTNHALPVPNRVDSGLRKFRDFAPLSSQEAMVSLNDACATAAQAVANTSHTMYTLQGTLPSSSSSSGGGGGGTPCQLLVAAGTTNVTLLVDHAFIRGIVFAQYGTTQNISIRITNSVSTAPIYVFNGSRHHFFIQATRFVFYSSDAGTVTSFNIGRLGVQNAFVISYPVGDQGVVEDANATFLQVRVEGHLSGAVEGGFFKVQQSMTRVTIHAEDCALRWTWDGVHARENPEHHNVTCSLELIHLQLIRPQVVHVTVRNLSVVAQVSEGFSVVILQNYDESAAALAEHHNSTMTITDAMLSVLVQGPRAGDQMDHGRWAYRRSVGLINGKFLPSGFVIQLQDAVLNATIVPQRAEIGTLQEVGDEAYCYLLHLRMAHGARSMVTQCALHCLLPENASIPFGLVQTIGLSLIGIETHSDMTHELNLVVSDCQVRLDVLATLCPYQRDVSIERTTRIATSATTLFLLRSVVYLANAANVVISIQRTTLATSSPSLVGHACFMMDSPSTIVLFGAPPQSTTMVSVLNQNSALVLFTTSNVQTDITTMFVAPYWRGIFASIIANIAETTSTTVDGTRLRVALDDCTMEAGNSTDQLDVLAQLLEAPAQLLRINQINTGIYMTKFFLNHSSFAMSCCNIWALPMLALHNVSIGDGLTFDGSGGGHGSSTPDAASSCIAPSSAPYMAVLINCTYAYGGDGGGSNTPAAQRPQSLFQFSNISEGVFIGLHAAVLLLMCEDMSQPSWRLSHVSWNSPAGGVASSSEVSTAPHPEGSVFMLVRAHAAVASNHVARVALHCVVRDNALIDRRVVSVPHWAIPDAAVSFEAPCDDPGFTHTVVNIPPHITNVPALTSGLTALVAVSYVVPHVNPSLSMMQTALRGIRLSQKCDVSDDDVDEESFLSDVVENPLQLQIGGALPPTMTTAAGAVIGNALMCAMYLSASFAVSLSAATLHAFRQRRLGGGGHGGSGGWVKVVCAVVGQAKQQCGVAGALFVPYSALAQPVASAASGLLTFAVAYASAASDTSVAVMFALIAALLVMAPCMCWVHVILVRWQSPPSYPLEWQPLPRSDVVRPRTTCWARLSRFERFAFYFHYIMRYPNYTAGWKRRRLAAPQHQRNSGSNAQHRLHDPPDGAARDGSNHWWYDHTPSCIESYGQIVEPFRAPFASFFVAEVAMELLTGTVLGVGWVMAAHGGACSWALWTLLVVAVLWVLLLAALRPYASLLENTNAITIALLTSITIALEMGGDDDAAVSVATVETVLSFLLPAAQLLIWFVRWWFVLTARSRLLLVQLLSQGQLESPLLAFLVPPPSMPLSPRTTDQHRSRRHVTLPAAVIAPAATSRRPKVLVGAAADQAARLEALVQLICDASRPA